MESMIVSWNGRLVTGGTVDLPVTDPLFLRGEGVFETMRFEGGRVCLWARHLARLQFSARAMGWSLPPANELERRVVAVVEANGLAAARVRLTMGREILVTAEELPEDLPGLEVVTCEFPVNERSPLAGIKATSYAEPRLILDRFGVGEVIRPNSRGEVCEGCYSNLFFVKGGRVFTPALESGCLPGVMRAEVMDRLEVEEGLWPVEVLQEAEEVWLTNAIRRVRQVTMLDGREMAGPSALFHEIRLAL